MCNPIALGIRVLRRIRNRGGDLFLSPFHPSYNVYCVILLISLVLVGCICISAQTSSDSEAQTEQAATEPTTERNTLMREYEMAAMTSAMYARDLELLEPYLRETQADPDRVMLVEYDTAPMDMMSTQDDEAAMLESDSDFEVSAPGFGGGYGGFGGGYGGYGGFGGGFGGKKGKKIPPFKKVPYKKVPYKKVPIKKGKKGGFGGFGGFGGGYGI